MIAVNQDRSRTKSGCLLALFSFSVCLSLIIYPMEFWWWFIVFGLHALVSLFFRVGWVIPFTMAGVYFGMLVLDAPGFSEGPAYWQMRKTVSCILAGTVIGFGVGVTFDMIHCNRKVVPEGDSRNSSEQKSR